MILFELQYGGPPACDKIQELHPPHLNYMKKALSFNYVCSSKILHCVERGSTFLTASHLRNILFDIKLVYFEFLFRIFNSVVQSEISHVLKKFLLLFCKQSTGSSLFSYYLVLFTIVINTFSHH